MKKGKTIFPWVKIKKLEEISEQVKNQCFERLENQAFQAEYEIRSLLAFDFSDNSILVYGDKRGNLVIYNRTTGEDIKRIKKNGSIDILEYKTLSENESLLFVGVRFKGIEIFRLEQNQSEIGVIKYPQIEKKKYMKFLFPNVTRDIRGEIKEIELFLCFDDGEILVYRSDRDIAGWKKTNSFNLPHALSCYTIDREKNPGSANLFLGNSVGDIFKIPFSEDNGFVIPQNEKELEERKILTIKGAVIECMIPLSSYMNISPHRPFYPDYCGIVLISYNEIICVYEKNKGKNNSKKIRTITKSFPHRLFDVKCLCFPDYVYTVVSDLKNNLHLIKNITTMDPIGKNLEVMFDGESFTLEFDDRIIRFSFAHPLKKEKEIIYKAYMGMGNHTVLPINICDSGLKLKEAKSIFQNIEINDKDRNDSGSAAGEKIFPRVDYILDKTRYSKSRTAVKFLLLLLMEDWLENESQKIKPKKHPKKIKPGIQRIIYKILDDEKTSLVLRASGFLSKIEKHRLLSPDDIDCLQLHIKKFILDGKSYSNKQKNLSKLSQFNKETGNPIDEMIYKGILIERQYDQAFSIHFGEKDGEVIGAAPFIKNFLIFTSIGKIFYYYPGSLVVNTQCYDLELKNRKINKFYLGEKYIYLLARDNNIIVVESEQLSESCQTEKNNPNLNKIISIKKELGLEGSSGTAVCMSPFERNRGDKCLIGTNRGEIYYIEELKNPVKIFADYAKASEILDLRSFFIKERHFITAGCWNGTINVYEIFSREDNIKLEPIDSLQLDAHAVERLLIFPMKDETIPFPLIVAGTGSGRCYGLCLCSIDEAGDKISLIHEWCYECDESIKTIHPFSTYIDNKKEDFILISSLDSFIHVLTRNGISVNTIHTAPPLNKIIIPAHTTRSPEVEAFVTTTDNDFVKARFYIQKKIRQEFEQHDPEYGEEYLLKFKSINIEEKFFKSWYYRKSLSFDSLAAVIDEIDTLVECTGHEYNEKSHILTSLFHRLYTGFFEALLEDHPKYYKVKQLFIKTRNEWGYPGSFNNARIQIYWIRSLLLGCYRSKNPVEMLNRWFKVGKIVAKEFKDPEIDPKNLIRNFIINPFPFIRVKTLQYFQRFVMDPVPDKQDTDETTNLDPELVESISAAIIEVLRMYQFEKTEGSPSWIELESARLLIRLIVNKELCPIRLCYNLWKNNIHFSFFLLLSNSAKIFQGPFGRREDVVIFFRASANLLAEMNRDNPQISTVMQKLYNFCERCRDCSVESLAKQKTPHCKNVLYKEFVIFFLSLSKFLGFNDIDKFNDTSGLEELRISPAEELIFFNYKDVVNEFIVLSGQIKRYYWEKYEDMYTLKSLKYSTFQKTRDKISDIKKTIGRLEGKGLRIEIKLYNHILKLWENIILEEIDTNIILDFANAIREYKDQCIDLNESMDMGLVFNNIFTRLNILAECTKSYIIYLDNEGKNVIVNRNDGEKEEILANQNLVSDDIPGEWLTLEKFSSLVDKDIEDRYKGRFFSYMLHKTPMIDQTGTQAVYLFFWEEKESRGYVRLKSREILGEFITSIAYLWTILRLQQESQEDFFRIVSHELRQILVGIGGWISTLREGHLEKNPNVRKEYYERAYNALEHAQFVIRGLLSFREYPRLDIKECELDKEIKKTVDLEKIDYKDYRLELLPHTEPGDYKIVTDPALVCIAVLNLLTNARKYNPKDKPVELLLSRVGNNIYIKVEDQGIGIPKNEHKIIFEKFKRGKFAEDNDIEGFGIGLTVAKRVIEAIGGEILLESRVDKGSTFTIRLNANKFSKIQTILTNVIVKKKPNFDVIENADIRQVLAEKLEYNQYKNTLSLRGILNEEEFKILKTCYRGSKKFKKFNLDAIQKLYDKSNEELKKLQ